MLSRRSVLGPGGRTRAFVFATVLPALFVATTAAPAGAQLAKTGDAPWTGVATPAARDVLRGTFPGLVPTLEALLASPRQDYGLDNAAVMAQLLESLRQASSAQDPAPSYVKGERPEWDEVYARCAPGVLFLVGENATGTGFVVDRDGFALTNHHVASTGAFDRAERTWSLQAYRGEIDDEGQMNYQPEPIEAVVYAWDSARDLALLRLDTDAFTNRRFRPLELASSTKGSPLPGQDIALIGHAGIGLLWSMKPGHVSAIGRLSESTPNVLTMLHSLTRQSTSTGTNPLQIVHDHMSDMYGDWIGVDTRLIQSTAVTSPGDSGGPLLNADAEVVGIAMGLLSHQQSNTTAFYYVHLDELHAFLDDHSKAPLVEVAEDIWHSDAVRYSLGSLPSDGEASVLLGLDGANKPTVVALDLDASKEFASHRGPIPLTSAVVGVHALGEDAGYVAAYFDGDLVGLDRAFEPLWHEETGRKIFCSDLSDDRKWCVVGLADGTAVLLDARHARVVGRWSVDGSPIHAVEFAADSQSFWVASAQGDLRRLSTSGEELARLAVPATPVSVAASPDDASLAVVTHAGVVTLLNCADASVRWTTGDARAMQCRFDPAGDAIVVSPIDDRSSLSWLSVESGEVTRELELPASPYFFELDEGGSRVAVSLAGGVHVLCDVASGTTLGGWETVARPADPRMMVPGASNPTASEFALLGGELVTGGRDGALYRIADVTAEEVTSHRALAEGIDVAHVVRDRAFDAEFAMVLDYELHSAYALYDLDNDGRFEQVRLDDDGDGLSDAQFEMDGERSERSSVGPGQDLVLPPSHLPESWRPRYVAYLSGKI